MKLIIHGAAKEVGRSCIEAVMQDNTRVLLDAGVKLSEEGTGYPEGIKDPAGLSAVFISHAHLDHTGYLPFLDNQGMRCPIFATAATKRITKLLLFDAFKIGRLKHETPGYEEEDIEKSLSFMRRVKADERGKMKGIGFEYFKAGHIPGSASIMIEAEGKKLLYTGDINTDSTRLLKGAETDYLNDGVDVMISEATYGDRDHPNRQITEKDFIRAIEDTIAEGGSVIIPVFAVGRAQEILLALHNERLGVPVYLDGMAKEATEMTLQMPKSIRDARMLADACQNVKFVKGGKQRKSLMEKQAVYVTTSGMLTGGPVMEYLKKMAQDSRNSILLTGYQGEHTNGRLLLEGGCVFLDGWKTKVSCKVRQFDFSAHSGQSQLRRMIKQANPQRLILNHGDAPAIKAMQEWAEALDIETDSPDLGGSITV